MGYQVPLGEMETTINLYPSQIQTFAEVYSCMPWIIRRLRKLAEENPSEVFVDKDDGLGVFFRVPASWVQIRKPRQMNYSDEQKAAAAARLAAARAKQQGR